MQTGWEDQERERIEALRAILEREQGRPVSHAEASEIGRSLVNFYEALSVGIARSEREEPTQQYLPID